MRSTLKKSSPDNPFLGLTWMDIQEWAGGKILSRGKSYQRSGFVQGLAVTKENRIVAWVEGSVRYATMVSFKRGKLSSRCTCPYGVDCKHGVAVVIEYLESLKKKEDVPVVSGKDKRIVLIKGGKTAWPDQADEDDGEDEDSDDEAGHQRSGDPIDDFLRSKSRDELEAMVKELSQTHSEIRNDLTFKSRLSSPSLSALTKTVSKEIDKTCSESGWQNHWRHSGYTPDYSRVNSGLERLSTAGNFDEVVKLGKKLYTKGMEQAGRSDDEGETAQEIADTLGIVFDALQRCSQPDADKIEQAIDWELADEYSLSDGLEKFWKKRFGKGDWNTVADRLLRRLSGLAPDKEGSDFHRNYERDKLTDQIINALDHAGREQQSLDLCTQEAPLTGSFSRLVTRLRAAGKKSEAEEWIRTGIRATQDKLPGIASGLRNQLLEIRNEQRDWLFSASIKADEFFEQPSVGGYAQLKKACEKAKVWGAVRPEVISYLNSGMRPSAGSPGWVLPDTGIAPSVRNSYTKPPFTTVLVEIALLDKDIDEALRLYDDDDRTRKGHPSWGGGWGGTISHQIAEAAQEKFPDRSIAIWKRSVESHIDRTSPKEYSIALGYVNRIRKTMKKADREKEFQEYVAEIKSRNLRKIRLVEMLDSLSGRRIVDV